MIKLKGGYIMTATLNIPENKITVITGKNGSGKTRLLKGINGINEQNWARKNYIVLDCDSHNHLNEAEIKNFALDLKTKSKTNTVVIASMRDEIIDIADVLITLKDRP